MLYALAQFLDQRDISRVHLLHREQAGGLQGVFPQLASQATVLPQSYNRLSDRTRIAGGHHEAIGIACIFADPSTGRRDYGHSARHSLQPREAKPFNERGTDEDIA